MAKSVNLPQITICVIFIHPAIVLFPVSAPAKKKLNAAMTVSPFINNFRHLIELAHVVI